MQLVEEATDLSCRGYLYPFRGSHSFLFVGNLEGGGDTYINVTYKEKRSIVDCPVQTSPTMICINTKYHGRLNEGKMNQPCTGHWKKVFPTRSLISIIDEGKDCGTPHVESGA